MARLVCDQCLALVGQLSFEQADQLASEGMATIEACVQENSVQEIHVDLARLQHGSSVAVVVLMSWLRFAKARKVRLSLRDAPQSLLATLAALGVVGLFELAP